MGVVKLGASQKVVNFLGEALAPRISVEETTNPALHFLQAPLSTTQVLKSNSVPYTRNICSIVVCSRL